jgi:branched-chain amino acid transport system permease protein
VSTATQFYLSTLLIYIGVDFIACWALNLQFGVAGILSFCFIIFQAAGAYTAAVLTLGPAGPNSFQQYFGGAHLPFPLPELAAALVGAALALLVGLVTLRRLRRDYQGIVMLVVSLIATLVASNATGLVNGSNGLSLVPKPLSKGLNLSPYGTTYQWVFAAIVIAIALLSYVVVHRITSSPYGRVLRAIRDNERAAAAVGKNAFALRLGIYAVGGALGGVSGALLVQSISAWSPSSWLYPETFSFFAAVIVGGSGNDLGVAIGALLVPVGFLEAVRFMPTFGGPELVGALEWIAVGLLLLAFLWFRPRGVVPERRRRYPAS